MTFAQDRIASALDFGLAPRGTSGADTYAPDFSVEFPAGPTMWPAPAPAPRWSAPAARSGRRALEVVLAARLGHSAAH